MPNEQYKQWRQWGATHHFPQLVLSSTNPPDVLRAGEVSWTRFFGRERSPSRIEQAAARMRQWDALLSCCPSDYQRSDEGQEACQQEEEAPIS